MPKAKDKQEILEAAANCGGDLSVFAATLGIHKTSTYYLLNRYPDIKDIIRSQQGGTKNERHQAERLENGIDFDTETPELTPRQIDALKQIDLRGNGLSALVNDLLVTVLFKLEERGLIKTEMDGKDRYARLTEDGEIALILHTETPDEEPAPAKRGRPAKASTEKSPSERELNRVRKGRRPKNQTLSAPAAPVVATEQNHEVQSEQFWEDMSALDALVAQQAEPQPEPETERHIIYRHPKIEACEHCGGCEHRRLLEFILTHHPELYQLYDNLKQIDELAAEARRLVDWKGENHA